MWGWLWNEDACLLGFSLGGNNQSSKIKKNRHEWSSSLQPKWKQGTGRKKHPWSSKHVAWTSSVTWGLDRNAYSQARLGGAVGFGSWGLALGSALSAESP